MIKQSENMTHMYTLWQEYVNSDPDLRRLENEKRALERKHIVLASARRRAEMERRQRRLDLLRLIPVAVTGVMVFVTVYLLAIIASVL